GATDTRLQLPQNSVQAVDRPDVPSQRQDITPLAFGMKQGLEQNVVGLDKRPFELRKPIRRNRSDGLFSCQHSRSQTLDLRGIFRLYKLPRLRSRSEGTDGRDGYA